jgi:uncharacterized membrane protein
MNQNLFWHHFRVILVAYCFVCVVKSVPKITQRRISMTKLMTLAIAAMISVSSLAFANEEKGATAPAAGTVEQSAPAKAEGKSDAQEAKKAHKKEKKAKK